MKSQMLRNKWFYVAAAVVAAGCAASTASQGYPPDGGDNGSPDAGTTGPSGDDSAAPGDDAGPAPGIDAAPPSIALPFYVSDQFLPTGFMGPSLTSITLSHDATLCKTPRQTGAGGDCYTATWAPLLGDAGSSWAGVYWQSPANNWGSKPGKPIAPGATKVSFYAAGAKGGESIQLCAGGINSPAGSASLPYSDSFTVKQPAITLTTDWAPYSISLQGTSYTSVLGAFCWVATTTASESVTFYLDDIKWE
jgi:hypothetical protein